MLLPYFASQAAEQLINEKALVAEAHRMACASATTNFAMSSNMAAWRHALS